jgi:hypothetical protein
LGASSNFTGNPENGGGTEGSADWVMESDNIDIRETYFTDAIQNFKGLLHIASNSSIIFGNKLMRDVCGNIIYLHKDISGYPINPRHDLSGKDIKFPSGSVVVWGNPAYGGLNNTSIDLSSDVVSVEITEFAFAALKSNGSVVCWGDSSSGGVNNTGVDLSSGVVKLYSNKYAFAALKSNGSVVTWGHASYGGVNNTGVDLSSGIIEIYSNAAAFAALKSNGSVVTWGAYGIGGNYTGTNLSSGVISISSNGSSFAALKSDGSVVVWGNALYGGSNNTGVDLSSGVVAIYPSMYAFAALKSNGSVVVWGDSADGGINNRGVDLTSGVVSIYSTWSGFAALKSNGSVVVWGGDYAGGLNNTNVDLSSGVVTIFSNGSSFAALKSDGSVVVWGESYKGGANNTGIDLSSGVVSISSGGVAFAALKPATSVDLTRYYYPTGGFNFNGITIPCLVQGTLIATPKGHVPVDLLYANDEVLTSDGRIVRIINCYRTIIDKTTNQNAPYKIPARTFGPFQPNEILLSPLHAFQIRKNIWEIPLFAATRYSQIKQLNIGKPVTYYHIELPNYFTDNLIANGNIVESYGVKALKEFANVDTFYSYNKSFKGYVRISHQNALRLSNKA